MVESLKSSYPLSSNDTMENNHTGVILNVDGSCLGSPTRTGYIGILRNDAGFYLSGFSGYLHDSSNILYAELYAMISGLSLANEKGIVNLICYSDSLLCTNIITGPILKFHIYAVWFKTKKSYSSRLKLLSATRLGRVTSVRISWLSLVPHRTLLSSVMILLLRSSCLSSEMMPLELSFWGFSLSFCFCFFLLFRFFLASITKKKQPYVHHVVQLW